jgi:hypothetical protein
MVVVPPTEHHDQEVDHELQREIRIEPEHLGAQAPRPSPASPEPTAKVSKKMRFTLNAQAARHAWSSTDARSRLPKRVRDSTPAA